MKHQQRIEEVLDAELAKDPVLAAFCTKRCEERFFVKNLERVQGDERDAIILSVGYGFDSAGKLPLRFGPVLQEQGYRRINVAVTRARERMTVVSSFTHHDLPPERVHGRRGLAFLRGYLEFASTGGQRLADSGASDFPPNQFEADCRASRFLRIAFDPVAA
jgi:hypothetical protein